jgi:hypothetical protein
MDPVLPEAPSPRLTPHNTSPSRGAPRCTLNPVEHSANITFRSLRTGALVARPMLQRLQASGAQAARVHVAHEPGLGLQVKSNSAWIGETGLRPRRSRRSGGESPPRLANFVACRP